ncbi:MAG TPA: hypothetical protein DC054_02490 [Blastocatellia bacterium]|nr:hypothetical protein [Blastocatellia bacterium]
MVKRTLLTLVVIVLTGLAAAGQGKRKVAGIIYFTNNTPPDVQTFPVEIVTPNRKRVIATTLPDDRHQFEFRKISRGKYLLKLTWPNRCVLWYRMDLTKESKTQVKVIMDAACAHFNGTIQNLPEQ